jgi:hypothetical protein
VQDQTEPFRPLQLELKIIENMWPVLYIKIQFLIYQGKLLAQDASQESGGSIPLHVKKVIRL